MSWSIVSVSYSNDLGQTRRWLSDVNKECRPESSRFAIVKIFLVRVVRSLMLSPDKNSASKRDFETKDLLYSFH